jgi:hypothetical protein
VGLGHIKDRGDVSVSPHDGINRPEKLADHRFEAPGQARPCVATTRTTALSSKACTMRS